MNEINVVDIFFKAEGDVQFYWQFYIVGITVLTGWLISLKRNLTLPLKLLISIVFLLFMAMNIYGLLMSYDLINSIQIDLLPLKNSQSGKREIVNSILNMCYPKLIIWLVHGIVDIIILVLICSDKIWEIIREREPDSTTRT